MESGIPNVVRNMAMALANTCGGVPVGRPSLVASAPTAISAVMAKRLSNSMAPKDTGSMFFSFLICLLAVPEDTSAWKPDTAPQAIVTNRVGNK